MELDQAELKFYPENPRIYSIVHGKSASPTQKEIFEQLSKADHVKHLVGSIRSHGGLMEPVIVKRRQNIVYEGNSRLAAYRILADRDPIKWGKMLCQVLPADIPDSVIFAMLGEYHIVGKKDWAPYEQGGYLWRRHYVHKLRRDLIAKEINYSIQKVDSLISTYQFMIDHKDQDTGHWSYYFEYLKSRQIHARRKEFKHLDNTFSKLVRSGKISRAVEVRDMLPKICTARGKSLTAFLSMKKTLSECHEIALAKGVGSVILNRMKKFREYVSSMQTKKEYKALSQQHKKKCNFEISKISQALKRY